MASKMQDARMSPNKIAQDSKTAGQGGDKNPRIDDNWLMIARDAYNESETYYEANIRKDHQRNMAHFQSRHAPGSKYFGEAYKYRHKGFRPKTRSMVRRQEAALLKSMFSTADFVTVKAARSAHPSHRISAEINQKLLQYRLENTIPWFQTVLGAYQDSLNSGICISHQFWDYEEEGQGDGLENEEYATEEPPETVDSGEGYTEPSDEQQELIDPGEDTETLTNKAGGDDEYDNVIKGVFGKSDPEIIRDTCTTELRPPENVFFSVACDWRDPANTSPYIIDKIPMFIDEIKAMARPRPGSGRQPWFDLTEAKLLTGITTDYDQMRREREGNREDSKDQRHLHRGFDVAWVHRNIVRKNGRDWLYYTLGVHHRLSEPVPLRQEYPWLKPGERPYVIGFASMEAHKNYPESMVGLGARTQQDANVLNNTRFDNVELSLNRRYIVKRSAQIDYRGLQRNVPGGVTETDDPNNDIKIENPPDVTSSSYEEQNRINADYDELLGMFSASSVSSNQSMNETVGGMKLLAGDADSLSEYPMMVFMITWVLPVLRQLIRLEQSQESDAALLNLMGEEIELWQRFKFKEGESMRVTDRWIQGSMNIQVAAGWGSVNPDQRIARMAQGFGIIFQIAPGMVQRLDGEEVTKEVMGMMGYQGSERFFPKEGPKVPAAPQQQNEGEISEQDQGKLDQEMIIHQQKMEADARKLQWDIEKFYRQEETKAQQMLQQDKLNQQQYEEKMARIETDRQTAIDEMKVKLRMGSGI